MDLEAARTAMIDSQVRPNDVTDRRLISAMAAVPRETFVPAARVALPSLNNVNQRLAGSPARRGLYAGALGLSTRNAKDF